MTSNIDAMEAGPEMDVLIATHVMRWNKKTFYEGFEKAQIESWFDENDSLIHSQPDRWQPSTSIADAWVVVEDRNKFRSVCINIWHEYFECIIWLDNKDESIHGKGKTAALAICRAVLKAVMK